MSLVDISGRASRAEFWAVNMGLLVLQGIALIALMIVMGSELQQAGIDKLKGTPEHGQATLAFFADYKIPFLALMLAPLVLEWMTAQRRLNDRGVASTRAIAYFIPSLLLWKSLAFEGAATTLLLLNYGWPVWCAFALWYYIELGCMAAPMPPHPTLPRGMQLGTVARNSAAHAPPRKPVAST